ncbi:mucin-binding protein [Lactobacillus johnsonii]|uniref:mucin-binding protein n=1 Tax=Lactobacillus johnsonii TaxID=33959 RepID=UPI003211C6DA
MLGPPTTQNMSSVDSKTPSEVGYDKVDISIVGGVTVYPGQKVNDVTVTYTKNKSPEVTQKATLEIIDNNDANAPKQLASFSNEGKSEDQITFANSNEILQSYLSQGYKLQKTAGNLSGDAQSGYTYPTYGNIAQDFKIYLIHDTEDKTETAQATAQVHYVVADNGVQAPADSDLQTITYTRTNKVDKVTGAVVNEGDWKADKNAFTNVDSPDLSKDGYTPSLETVQFNVPERNVNQRVTVVYNRSAQAADLQIIDDNDPQNQRVLATYSAGGESGKQISFGGSNIQLQNYLKNGYTFEKSEGQGMSGDATNGFTYPSFDNDSNTNQSFKIYLKHATSEKKETATTTAHVHYIMADGTKAPDDSPTQTINWSRTNTVDQVTSAIVNEGTWTSDKSAFTDVDSPEVTGYTPGTKTVKFATPERGVNQVVTVVYTKDAPTPDKQNALVVYQDVNDPAHPVDLGQSDQLTGQAGDSINYSTADKIAEYEKQGYVLVSNGFDANGTKPSFDNINGNTQTFYVTFKHGIQPVTPTTPGTPDQPINPDNPDGPKYPSSTDKTNLTKDVTRTVTYEGAGDKTPSPVTDTLHFQGTGYLDKVTGKWTDANGKELSDQTKGITWTITDGTKDEGSFNLVPTKHIDGYTSKVVTDGADDGNGNVKSYTGITHASDNINVVVQYNPIVAEQGNLIVKFHDDTDNKDLTGVGTDTGTQDVGTQITYNPSTDLTNLENKGYVYVSTDGNIPPSIVKGTTTVTIHVKHGTVPVTPENPGTPDQPINPNDPDPNSPKYPTGTDKASIDKTITRTVHYEGADQYTPNDVQQPVHFTASGELDRVTGKWTKELTWSEDQTFNGVTTPKIPGYHVVSVDKDTTDNQNVDSAKISHSGADYTVTVKYAKDADPTPDTTTGKVAYIDDTTGSTLKTDSLSGNVGANIDYTTQDKINNYINMGYKLVTNNFTDGKEIFNKDASKNNFEVHLVHDTVPVNPDHPDDKNGFTKEYLDRTITRDVTYVDEQGNEMSGLTPEHQETKFQGSGYLDNVTGKWVTVENGKITGLAQGLTWTPDKDASFDAIAAKTADGYHVISVSGNGISGFTVGQDGSVTAQTVNKDTPSSTIKVVYAKTPVTPTPANGSIVYIDDTTGNTLENASFGGKVGDKINYTTADRIANYEKKGYDLVSNNFKDGQEVFTDGENKFEVHLVHATTPITPENPGKPGQEVPNPNDPNNPRTIPDNFVPQTLTKTVTRDVTYVYEDGSQAETPVHQTFTFNGNGFVDLVTGQLVTVENGKITGAGKITWNADNHDFEATKVIDTTQYNIVKVSENNTSANVDMSNGVVASETITPNSQNSSVVITLAKKEAPTPADQTVVGKQVVHYVDEQGNKLRDDNTNDTFVFTKSGKIGQWNETSHKYSDANAVVIDGYISDQKTYEGQTATPEDANKEITIVYYKIGKIIPVDPSGNQIPDAPTPGYHNDPTDPTKVTPNEPTPNIPGWTTDVPNVTPEVPTKDTPVPYTKNTPTPTPVPANGSIVYIDDTTGNTLENASFGGNVGDKIDYTTADRIANYTSKGYELVGNNFKDGEQVFTNGENKFEVHLAHRIETKDANKTITRDVTYVYEDGSQANSPVHQTVTFMGKTTTDKVTGHTTTKWDNDSQNFDATKAIDTTQYNIVKVSENNTSANVDMSNGVVASETITPTGQNSNVVITLAKKPVTPTPVEKGTVIITYLDKTTGKTLETATSTGNEGSNVNYSTKDTITKYTNQGYKLSHDGYPTGNVTYTNDTQTYTVEFVHDTVPVTPENPGTPGQPINPNDPTGPKYPDGTGQTDLTKTVTRTINYVGEGLNVPASHTEIEFTGRGVLDKVTGQWTTPLTWTVKGGNSDSGNFEQVDGPNAAGYYITNISSSNEDLGDIDSTTGTVASKTVNHANGNIVITINYAKKTTPIPADQTVVGKQVVHYVDEQGNKLRDDNTNDTFVFTKPGKAGQWNETSHKYADANAVVIDGYVSDQKTYTGQTATPEDANKEITIVYHKIGKIIPVDPSGNPIPDAPNPGYHNDPTDPTKVTPNEPTPNIPGWTTNIPNVTPEVPTKDTNVPYTKNEVPTPDQGSIEIVVHDNTTNTDLSNYGKKSGKQNVGTNFNFDKSTLIKDLENKGYKIVNPDVEIPSVVIKGDQKIVIYVESKEEPKDPITPEVPNLPAGDDNNNLPVPEKKETSNPTQSSENKSTPNVEKVSVTTQSQNSSDPVLPTKERNAERNVTPHTATLPQTGNTDDSAAAIAGGTLALIGLAGLTGASSKRRKD